MVEFDLWKESFIFIFVFAPIIIIPCILVSIWGCKLIEQLGKFPSQTAIIQLSIFWKLVIVEVLTFASLLMFFKFFSVK